MELSNRIITSLVDIMDIIKVAIIGSGSIAEHHLYLFKLLLN